MPHCRVPEARHRCRIDGSTGDGFPWLARGNEGLHSIRVRVIVMMHCAAVLCGRCGAAHGRCLARGWARYCRGGGMLNPSRALFDVVRRRRLIFFIKEAA